MSFQICGDNRKENIEADTVWADGDLIMVDPGVGFCSSRMYLCRHFDEPIDVNGFFANIFDAAEWPDYGNNNYAIKFHAGMDYYLVDKGPFSFQESHTITHTPDPEYKRYFEAWITFPPSSNFSLAFESGTDVFEGSSYISLFPSPYPDLHQTITLPAAAAADHNTIMNQDDYEGIRCTQNGEVIAVWGGKYLIIYEWNDTSSEYDETFFWNDPDCTTVYSAGIGTTANGLSCVICYWDSSGGGESKWAYVEKDGTWSVVGKYSNPAHTSGPVHLAGNYIISGGTFDNAASYSYSSRSLVYSSTEEPDSDWGTIDPDYRAYFLNDVSAFGVSYNWFIPPGRYYPSFAQMYYNDVDFGYIHTEDWAGPEFYYSDPDYGTYTIGPVFMYHWAGGSWSRDKASANTQWLLRTHLNQLYPYPYGSTNSAARILKQPTSIYSGYVYDRYCIGFTSTVAPVTAGVWWMAFGPDGAPTRLSDYVFSTHKIYDGRFYPVKYPYYLTNNMDGTLKLITIGDHYTDRSPGTAILKTTSGSDISTLDDFIFPEVPAGTDVKFLFSWDNITYYKYTTSWVVESDVANGNTLAQFIAGCQFGLAAPVGTKTAYVKIMITTTDDNLTPQYSYQDMQLTLTVLSTSDNAYLCDDSHMRVEFISPTQTQIISLVEQDVILAGKLCIIAPPYDEYFED